MLKRGDKLVCICPHVVVHGKPSIYQKGDIFFVNDIITHPKKIWTNYLIGRKKKLGGGNGDRVFSEEDTNKHFETLNNIRKKKLVFLFKK
jgi:hypothetical protein